MARCQGPGCGVEFEARRSWARYCSTSCRKRASRARAATATTGATGGPLPEVPAAAEGSGLVAAVRAELDGAGRLESVSGQLALELAGKLSGTGAAGATALSRELRTVMASALGRPDPVSEPEGAPYAETDEVQRARQARERKARQAAAR